jgi:glycosyltransferase involved in cell wall biosynthesis
MSMVRQRCNFNLAVAGRGPETTALEAQTARLGLADRVHFVGQVSGQKKTWLLQNGRAMIVPSRIWEAFGVVAIESFAAGRPVIVSQLQGLANLVAPNVTGRIVPPESPADIAQAIVALANDASTAHAMGAAARNFVQAYDWRGIAQRHVELYQDLIERTRKARNRPARVYAPLHARRAIAASSRKLAASP